MRGADCAIAGQVRRLQARLSALYALDLPVDAADYVVDDAGRAALAEALGGAPSADREALWVHEEEDALNVALCVADELAGGDALDDADLDRYCALLEGVSHLVYLFDRALRRVRLTLLEMELQAEVDKFLTTWFARHDAQVPVSAGDLRHRLFVQVSIPPRRDASEEARYRAANRYAARYCGHLQRRYLRAGRVHAMLAEVRRFWRMDQATKIAHIEAC